MCYILYLKYFEILHVKFLVNILILFNLMVLEVKFQFKIKLCDLNIN